MQLLVNDVAVADIIQRGELAVQHFLESDLYFIASGTNVMSVVYDAGFFASSENVGSVAAKNSFELKLPLVLRALAPGHELHLAAWDFPHYTPLLPVRTSGVTRQLFQPLCVYHLLANYVKNTRPEHSQPILPFPCAGPI